MISLDTPIEHLTRVGKTTASRLKKLGLQTVQDLIFYFPFRYDDFSKIFLIKQLAPGMVATVKAKIELIANRRSPLKRKILTEAVVSDGESSMRVIWFNQPYLTKVLKPGDEVFLSGKVEYNYDQLELVNPVYEKVKFTTLHTARLVPIYSVTGSLTQKQIRFLIKQALRVAYQIKDFLPAEVLQNLKLPALAWSLTQIHFPTHNENLKKAVARVKFDELFLLQLRIQLSKLEFLSNLAPAIAFDENLTKKFVASLPFTLTQDQKKAAWQILQDIAKTQPMNRLLEGEVGSGKTVVVGIAALNAAAAGWQTVFMAPTEILASQHYKTFVKFFTITKDEAFNHETKLNYTRNKTKAFSIKIGLLTRTNSIFNGEKIKKAELLKKIRQGEVDLIIGTHALISARGAVPASGMGPASGGQEKVEFKKLGLAVVDEQHRFGVAQRKALKEKSGPGRVAPHFLTLSATPIPRSLSLIFYGDLQLSKIIELPPGRKKVETKIIIPEQRPQVYNFVRKQIQAGRQAFVICPLIDPSDKLGVKSVTTEHEKLKQEIFPELNIDFLHGQMRPAEKEEKMKNFLENKINIMVSTSILEVGVDVPNATVMLIESAQRFGLAQLYQFRGRVGRANFQSYCFLFSDTDNEKTLQRLQALINAKDCFELAELDLQFRGPGEMFGTMQSGFAELKVATLQDVDLAQQAKEQVAQLLAGDQNLAQHPLLKTKVEDELKLAHLE